MQPYEHWRGGIGRADQDGQMLPAAIARSKRDQTSVLGISKRHARLGDAFEPGGSRIVFEHRYGFDGGEIAALREEGGSAAPMRSTRAAGRHEASLAKAAAA